MLVGIRVTNIFSFFLSLLKGAERLIKHLKQNNIPIAVATSSGADSVEVKTQKHQEVFDLFHHKVMGSSDAEVKEGKPAPDIFLVAASRFPDKPEPEQVCSIVFTFSFDIDP